ncbi:LPXTG cell wall anchor domain-containing protein [Enterococcus mundtii]|nr:LPXTG cell wall anchor domain-containing protein [Enterococcus mundtii]
MWRLAGVLMLLISLFYLTRRKKVQ